jgi:phage/plasmid-associated DNA primase
LLPRELALYLKGLAGTGKSTLVNFLLKLYVMANTTVFGNDAQKGFAFQNLTKYIYIWAAPEVKTDFSIDQAQFQLLVSVERIPIQAKHVAARDAVIYAHGYLASNTMPQIWQDYSGSIARRLLLLMFMFSPDRTDNSLMERMTSDELPFIIRKICYAYRMTCSLLEGEGVWSSGKVSTHILNQQQVIKQSMNPIAAFLSDTKPQFNQDYFVPMDTFLEDYQKFLKSKFVPPKQFTVDLYDQVFREYRLKIRFATHRWGKGPETTSQVIQGLCFEAYMGPSDMMRKGEEYQGELNPVYLATTQARAPLEMYDED